MTKKIRIATIFFSLWLTLAFIVPLAFAKDPDPETYLPRPEQLLKEKKLLDDPRSLMTKFHPSKILPPEIWSQLTWDKKEMSDMWAEIVGFKSPDVVGKIAPEIKPGKYTYKDLEKYPGLKELMMPEFIEHYIKPGGPPLAGNIPEFEIIPTRQYYYSLPIAKATKENLGKAKLDEAGYIIESSWTGGFPFPKPSGKFKARQVFANYFKKYWLFGYNMRIMGVAYGFNKNLKKDFDCLYSTDCIRLSKRTIMPPFGYYDERARKKGEEKAYFNVVFSPRDIKGTAIMHYYYEDPNRYTQSMMYVPSLRRIRKMSSSDTQDPINGQDITYDDQDGFAQKMSPTRYPYKMELIGDVREYLWPVSVDGTEYVDSKDGYSIKNVKMVRRPMYTVNMIQQDKNYVYSRRLVYVDAETFLSTVFFFYDQKGRLYRSQNSPVAFLEESGQFIGNGSPVVLRDYIDLHTTVVTLFTAPVFWERSQFTLKNMSRHGK